MTKNKNVFKLDNGMGVNRGTLNIVGSEPKYKPYVVIYPDNGASLFVKREEMEIMAVNILRALKSKKLKL
jgi:hypothetical protein